MSAILTGILLVGLTTAASAQYGSRNYGDNYQGLGTGSNPNSHNVRPHFQSDGDYVPGHRRTNPDSNPYNNYGTSPNYNPNNPFGTSRRGSGF
jgi:hypothetical protein